MAMYYLSDGKNYVMENEFKPGEYLITTYVAKAKSFTYKSAKGLVTSKRKKFSKFRKFYLVETESGKTENVNPRYKGNADVYVGDHDIEFDNGILDTIIHEADLIKSMVALDEKQLNEYKTILTNELSKKDSIISDIYHALLEYGDTHNGKRPQAHKIAKISYMSLTIHEERRKIKLCLRYVDTMLEANGNRYTPQKYKNEMITEENKEYKARTEFYQQIQNILCG